MTYIEHHEHIEFLQHHQVSIKQNINIDRYDYLLVPNSKFALRLLVLAGKFLELLDCVGLDDLGAEFHVAFCVFMAGLSLEHSISKLLQWLTGSDGTYINSRIVGQSSQSLVECCVHLLWSAFKETTASCNRYQRPINRRSMEVADSYLR